MSRPYYNGPPDYTPLIGATPNYNPNAGRPRRFSDLHPLWWVAPTYSVLLAAAELWVHGTYPLVGAISLWAAGSVSLAGALVGGWRSARIVVGAGAVVEGGIVAGGAAAVVKPALLAAVATGLCGVGCLYGGSLTALYAVLGAAAWTAPMIPAWLAEHRAENAHRRGLEASTTQAMYDDRRDQRATIAKVNASMELAGAAQGCRAEIDSIQAHVAGLLAAYSAGSVENPVPPQVGLFYQQQALMQAIDPLGRLTPQVRALLAQQAAGREPIPMPKPRPELAEEPDRDEVGALWARLYPEAAQQFSKQRQ